VQIFARMNTELIISDINIRAKFCTKTTKNITEHIDRTRLQNSSNLLMKIFIISINYYQYLIHVCLFSFDLTKHYFYLRHDGFETFTPCNQYDLTLDFVQTEYRKDMLTVYFQHIFSKTNWNETFLEYLLRVGQIHTTKVGSSSISVDYMYINALLCYIEQLLTDTIWNTENLLEIFKYKLMKSLKKCFYIQNDFLAMTYQNTWKGKKMHSDIPIVKFTKCWFM